MTELSLRLAVSLAQIAAVMGIVMLTVMILTLAERKVLGWMQDRMGPMEVGPYGILQPIADGLKLFFKEDIVPAGANKFMFSLAPILAMVPALIGFAVIPFGPNETIQLFGMTIKPFVISDINIGVLYILAFASIGAYGINGSVLDLYLILIFGVLGVSEHGGHGDEKRRHAADGAVGARGLVSAHRAPFPPFTPTSGSCAGGLVLTTVRTTAFSFVA